MTGNADSQFIWMDGELKPFQDANVHVLSHSLHYGSAAFEGIRAYKLTAGGTAIFRAREHMERFVRSTAVFDAELSYSVDQMVEAIRATVKANGFDECYIRPLAYFGNETRGLKLPVAPKMHVAIATWRWGRYLGDPEKGARVNIASFRRPDVASSLPWAKLSGNYLNSIMARREATRAGVDEAILLDQQGYVAEGSGENIFVLRNGELVTPPTGAILPGITRECVIDLVRTLGLRVREAPITRNQLYDGEEVFFTGTAAEITPIGEIDGRKIGDGRPGQMTRRVSQLFEKAVRGELPEFRTWLTQV